MAGLQNAGEFEIQKIQLLTSEGIVIDLMDSVVELVITEAINQKSIVGYIALQDNVSLTNIAPIIGQEYLILKIATPSIIDKNSIIDFTENVFHINKIDQRAPAGASSSVNVLQFTTAEIIHNQRTLVSRSLKGTHSDIVTKLMQNDLQCNQRLFIENIIGTKQ